MSDTVNKIDLAEIRKCFPARAILRPCKPKEPIATSGNFSIQVLCEPQMKEPEVLYCMESVKQILPVQEFYSITQGSNILIYWKYDKNLPITFEI